MPSVFSSPAVLACAALTLLASSGCIASFGRPVETGLAKLHTQCFYNKTGDATTDEGRAFVALMCEVANNDVRSDPYAELDGDERRASRLQKALIVVGHDGREVDASRDADLVRFTRGLSADDVEREARAHGVPEFVAAVARDLYEKTTARITERFSVPGSRALYLEPVERALRFVRAERTHLDRAKGDALVVDVDRGVLAEKVDPIAVAKLRAFRDEGVGACVERGGTARACLSLYFDYGVALLRAYDASPDGEPAARAESAGLYWAGDGTHVAYVVRAFSQAALSAVASRCDERERAAHMGLSRAAIDGAHPAPPLCPKDSTSAAGRQPSDDRRVERAYASHRPTAITRNHEVARVEHVAGMARVHFTPNRREESDVSNCGYTDKIIGISDDGTFNHEWVCNGPERTIVKHDAAPFALVPEWAARDLAPKAWAEIVFEPGAQRSYLEKVWSKKPVGGDPKDVRLVMQAGYPCGSHCDAYDTPEESRDDTAE